MKNDTKERQCGRPGCLVRFTPEHAQRLYCSRQCARLMKNAKAAAAKSRQRQHRATHCACGKPLDAKTGRGRPRKRCDDCRVKHHRQTEAARNRARKHQASTPTRAPEAVQPQ